jgi:hypothetical protein
MPLEDSIERQAYHDNLRSAKIKNSSPGGARKMVFRGAVFAKQKPKNTRAHGVASRDRTWRRIGRMTWKNIKNSSFYSVDIELTKVNFCHRVDLTNSGG